MPPQEGTCTPLTRHGVGQAVEQELQRWYPLQLVKVRDPLDHDEETAVHTDSAVVYDPANKLGYILGIDEIMYNTGKELLWKATHNGDTADNEPPATDGSRKRFYLCMLYQDNRCRAFHQCNNIHVDRARVSALRKRYHDCCRTRPVSRTWTVFPVPDPENPEHILRIRLGSTADTAGKEMGIQGRSVKLCDRHTKGEGCAHGEECSGLHLVSEVLNTFWVPCCVTHQSASASAAEAALVERLPRLKISIRSHGRLIPVKSEHIGITDGLKGHLKEHPDLEHFEFPRGKLCKRHKSRECKHGAHCNNIHVCREHFDAYYLERPKEAEPKNTHPTPAPTSPRTVVPEREVAVVPLPRSAVVEVPRATVASQLPPPTPWVAQALPHGMPQVVPLHAQPVFPQAYPLVHQQMQMQMPAMTMPAMTMPMAYMQNMNMAYSRTL
eukprot:Hpha_TRINITY_DN16559_c2_g3::TRINITY_DN16559_c2_g3_i1::g.134354::m.134354